MYPQIQFASHQLREVNERLAPGHFYLGALFSCSEPYNLSYRPSIKWLVVVQPAESILTCSVSQCFLETFSSLFGSSSIGHLSLENED
ncbi:hypothetical protein TNIN_490591 [Trichonephila inaurata madagascariensis]|uniref:Uncharacterized protein n=1 Tax=Trichonephila inaurata madagascariensis TaxID=2747483 RepID=A0A8X6WZV2_9ARAC|nr:hypothetical protein TNIN_490591 [Trichonephila inaurata madagascariensis]